jgi:energy-coupling factor transporter ATP-binding protein EcfA2
MELEFGKRLNLLTGDNGLGKSFLLDIAWWAMTRRWPAEVNPQLTSGKVALPTDKKQKAEIDFLFSAASRQKSHVSTFEPRSQNWTVPHGRPAIPGMVFYALADGSFAVWDPARNYWKSKTGEGGTERPPAYVFSPKEVWDGLQREDGTWLCNGLIRDWTGWQKEKGQAFNNLSVVLEVLSPSSKERLIPGGLTRVSLDDVRDMPTLRMPYSQDVPVIHASSGMKRIIALAYFLVWCREEHLKAKELLGEQPENKTVFLIDEVESHLHPKWQRAIIPALMKVMDKLIADSEIQLIAVTHSPLIMASVEPLFDVHQDAWFDLDLVNNRNVVLSNRQFVRRGDVRSWLVSEAFDLKSGYALETEKLLEEATQALSNESFGKDEAVKLDKRLRSCLSDTDNFWMRWRFVAEKRGWLS